MYSPVERPSRMRAAPAKKRMLSRADRHLVARVRERLAHVLRLDLRELLGVLVDHVGELEQHLGALAGGRLAPLGPGLLRGLDRAVDVRLRALGTSPIVSPVAGLMISAVSPSTASSHSPPTKFW